MTRPARLLLIAAPLFAAVTLGCGGKGNANAPARVTGSVTYKGAKLSAGTVAFHTAQGTYSATIDTDGSYTANELPVGEAKVTVETESANKDKKTPEYGKGKINTPGSGSGPKMPGGGGAPSHKGTAGSSPQPGGGPASGTSGSYTKIPEKYSTPDKSGLKTTLERGENKYDIPLTD